VNDSNQRRRKRKHYDSRRRNCVDELDTPRNGTTDGGLSRRAPVWVFPPSTWLLRTAPSFAGVSGQLNCDHAVASLPSRDGRNLLALAPLLLLFRGLKRDDYEFRLRMWLSRLSPISNPVHRRPTCKGVVPLRVA